MGYDAAGNLAWSAAGLPVGTACDVEGDTATILARKAERTYDAHGRRIRAWTPSAGLLYSLYSQAGQLLWQHDSRTSKRREYVYLNGSLVAERTRPIGSTAETITYQHTDALGTPVVKTSASRVILERREYEPYGKLLNQSLESGPGFTGHDTDPDTQYTYMQQRYYDPRVGRFWSVDPVTVDSAGGNFNRYWYANNNPYRFTDPDGRQAKGDAQRPPCEADCPEDKEQPNSPCNEACMRMRQLADHGFAGFFASQSAAKSAGDNAVVEQNGGAILNFLLGQPYLVSTYQISSSPELYSYLLTPIRTGMPPAVMLRGAAAGLITGYTRHGLNQAISRDGGRGVAALSILNAVRRPVSAVAGRGGTMIFRGADGTVVVVNQAGKVITTYGVPRIP
jgi:RHS repeat-associated protein